MIYLHDKENAVKRVLAGEKITKVCDDVGMSRGSLYTWLERYKSDGIEGLLPQSRRPKSNPNSLDEDNVFVIRDTALDNPEKNIRSLKLILKNKGYQFSISTIHKYLKRINISTREERRDRLLMWSEMEGENYLGPQRIEGLEALSSHFAERKFIAEKSGQSYYVFIENLQTGSQPYTEIRVWYFFDLFSFQVTAIIEDHNEWDDESSDHYKKFIESAGIRDDHVGSYCSPIFVWWKAYGDNQDSAPIHLNLNSTDFFTVSQKSLSKQLASTNIRLKFSKTGSTLPWAFISDFKRNFRKTYRNLTRHLLMNEPSHKRHKYFSQYIGPSLLAYNERKLSALFPRFPQTPNHRSRLLDFLKQHPSVELRRFLNSWDSGKKLLRLRLDIEQSYELPGRPSDWYATPSENKNTQMRYGKSGGEFIEKENTLQRYGSSGGEFGSTAPLDIEHAEYIRISEEKSRERKTERLKNDPFSRVQHEIDIKRHTNMSDPDCALRKMNDGVPFKLVYEKLIDEKPKGKYWSCPLCGKQTMSYYPKPNGNHVNNHGYCHPDQGGCGRATNSVNLIRLKLKYKFPQALKWLLANFNPVDYGVISLFILSDEDQKKYRH